VEAVRISEELKRYVVDLVGRHPHRPWRATWREPRASLALMKAAQALSLFDGWILSRLTKFRR